MLSCSLGSMAEPPTQDPDIDAVVAKWEEDITERKMRLDLSTSTL
jgi:hypothetical protein